jgi:hypothetical protein
MSGHRLFQDDLASVSISRLRASGVVTSDTESVEIVFGEGDEGLRREVMVVHRRFPNGGEWSFFVCPGCGRPARVLKLHEKPMCRRCCLRKGIGIAYPTARPSSLPLRDWPQSGPPRKTRAESYSTKAPADRLALCRVAHRGLVQWERFALVGNDCNVSGPHSQWPLYGTFRVVPPKLS